MIVDWISFTLPITPTSDDLTANNRAYLAMSEYVEPFANWCYAQDVKMTGTRRPYCNCIRWGDCAVFSGVNIDHILIEVSGRGCEALRNAQLLDSLLATVKATVTRIDIAIDINDLKPDEIIANGYSDRFRTHSRIESDTGITHYVGSVKSERYARVYRYNKPHPRSELCRVEIVHRKRYAKILATAIAEQGLMKAGLAALSSYGFQHPSVPTNSESVLETVAIVKGDQKTLRWLIAQCAPAFKRLVRDGTITEPNDFFKRYFVP